MLIHSEQVNGNTTGGFLAGNTAHIRGLCHHIIVQPAHDETVYNVRIINPSNAVVYERLSETGTLSELLQLPVVGRYTIEISRASNDEYFIIQLVIAE